VAKKTTRVGDVTDSAKNAAAKMGDAASEAVENDAPDTLFERVVPVPHADVYSELPFELVETGGEPTEAGMRPRRAAPAPRTPSKKPASNKPDGKTGIAKKVTKAAGKKAVKKSTPQAAKKKKAKR
jgi:hypothetical protein